MTNLVFADGNPEGFEFETVADLQEEIERICEAARLREGAGRPESAVPLRNEARALFFQFGDALTAYSGRNGEAERPEPQMSECSERARDGLMAARAA